MLLLHLLIGIFIGIFTGFLIALVCRSKCHGTIIVKYDKLDGPYLFLDLDSSIDDIANSEKVYFKVDSRSKHIV